MKYSKEIVALAAASLLALAACSGGNGASAEKTATAAASASTEAAAPVELNVFAAASLNKAFPEIADTVLKESDPNIKVTFNFQGSSTLVDQMKEGAPADVFASADQKNMTKATDAKLVDTPKPFASNVLTLIVPKGNPAKITGLDSSLDGKKLVVCAQGVPCGNATRQLGEADAGLVYTTDAKAAGDKVEIVEIPRANEVVNSYPIAATISAKNKEAAQKFIDAVLSEKGQAVLKKYGFSAPTSADKG